MLSVCYICKELFVIERKEKEGVEVFIGNGEGGS